MRIILTFILICNSAAAASQTRCQCSYEDWIGDCNANIERIGNSIRVTSNTHQCSRVDYYVNEHPYVTIVIDGTEYLELLGKSDDAKLSIQSCKVCRDAMKSKSHGNELVNSVKERSIDRPQYSVSPFSGQWVGNYKTPNGDNHPLKLMVRVEGNIATGFDDSDNERTPINDGRIQGNVFTYSYPNGVGRTEVTITLTGNNAAKWAAQAWPFNYYGEIRRISTSPTSSAPE